jgi:hypothetical protein
MCRVAVGRVNGILEVDRIEFQAPGILQQCQIAPMQSANGIGLSPKGNHPMTNIVLLVELGRPPLTILPGGVANVPHLTAGELWGLIGMASSTPFRGYWRGLAIYLVLALYWTSAPLIRLFSAKTLRPPERARNVRQCHFQGSARRRDVHPHMAFAA